MKSTFTYQKPELKYFRRQNRNNPTQAEKTLWKHLRKKQLAGYRFQRQYSVENYILDFYCPKARLGIEIDGGHHAEEEVSEYDKIRTINIESYNIKIIRFWNSEIIKNIQNVLETIYYYLENKYE